MNEKGYQRRMFSFLDAKLFLHFCLLGFGFFGLLAIGFLFSVSSLPDRFIMGRMESFEERTSEKRVDMSNAKSRKRRKVEWGDASDGDIEWAKSLSDSQLDLMVSVKQLAMERVRSTREKSLNGLLSPAGLRAIGIILEEFMMDRLQTLRDAPDSPSVIDELRVCLEKSEDEASNETNHVEMDEQP